MEKGRQEKLGAKESSKYFVTFTPNLILTIKTVSKLVSLSSWWGKSFQIHGCFLVLSTWPMNGRLVLPCAEKAGSSGLNLLLSQWPLVTSILYSNSQFLRPPAYPVTPFFLLTSLSLAIFPLHSFHSLTFCPARTPVYCQLHHSSE